MYMQKTPCDYPMLYRQAQEIIDADPFYVPREQTRPIHPFDEPVQQNAAVDSAASPEPAQMPDPGPEPDPEVLASQIMSSNFKVGLSQEEVDALLNGM